MEFTWSSDGEFTWCGGGSSKAGSSKGILLASPLASPSSHDHGYLSRFRSARTSETIGGGGCGGAGRSKVDNLLATLLTSLLLLMTMAICRDFGLPEDSVHMGLDGWPPLRKG